jgi:hypothetical protein
MSQARLSIGAALEREESSRGCTSVTNTVYLVAQDSEFSHAQFSIPRLMSVTAKVRF